MLNKLKNNYLIYLLIIVIGYAIFLRLYNLEIQSFWIDEGFSSYVSKNIFKDGGNILNSQYFLHTLSQILSFKLFGISDWSARFPSVIFSTLNIYLIYLISFVLFKDKKQAIFSMLIFSFLTWEITWARQARFYTLLQLLFSLNLYLTIKLVKDFSLKYLNLLIIFLYIGYLFHPFLQSNIILFIIALMFLFFKDRKKLFNKKSLYSLVVVVLIFIIEYLRRKYLEKPSSGGGIHYILQTKLIINLILNYLVHFINQLGVIFYGGILGFFLLLYKRKYFESFVLTFMFFLVLFAISYKGYLYHTRYVFILYPILIISFSYFVFYFYNKFRNKNYKITYLTIVILLTIFTAKFTFLPQTYYYIDNTSPQPNFKEAYKNIPYNKKVVSGFSMLCDWYYGNRGKCDFHLPVDYVGLPYSKAIIMKQVKDNYTGIGFLANSGQLEKGKTYYFVLDDLSIRRVVPDLLLKKVLKNGKIIYESGEGYNNIKVIEYKK